MASIYNYIILIVGISLLLAFAGVQNTTIGSILGNFIDVDVNPLTGNVTVTTNNFNVHSNLALSGLLAIIGIFALVAGVTAGILSRDAGTGIKATLALIIVPWIIVDLVALINYANSLDAFGGLLKIVTFLIYIPISIGSIIAITNWIGGQQ